MGDSIYDYATSEASSSTTGGWNTAENQDPSTVNDGMRAHKQNVAKFLKDLGGTITTTGSANAHAATLNQPIATTVPTGFAFKVKWGYTNTSATVNLNVNSIGNARVKVNYGGILADPIPGDIQAGAYGDIIFDGTNHVLLNPQQRAPYPTGHLYGLTLSNNGSDATNDIDIAVGSARDSTDAANIDLASALTKRLDADWSAGTGNGMRYSGAAITNTTYHIWLVKSSAGTVDVYADPSATAATVLGHLQAETGGSTYLYVRRIGSIVRSGGVIRGFIQDGDHFLLKAEVTETSPGTSPGSGNLAFSIPSGIRVWPIFRHSQTQGTTGVATTSFKSNDSALPLSFVSQTVAAGEVARTLIDGTFFTDTSAQLGYEVIVVSGTLSANSVITLGWVDPRGKGR